uniref:Somatotropin n=1 Tax=Paralichthys lethostigma TaxID=141886 RepID=A0A169_PARLE|nr:growth hormone precursor [Paralichthys lethostigma]ABJ90431.1 growth hormone precursor [Paralichthys lethostigma]
MNRVILLLSVMCVGVSSQPITENQRLFSIAVGRVQYLHLVAKKLFSDFENSLQLEDQRQLNKIFLKDFCHSDYFLSPIDKHETQGSSVQKLLSISYRLIESWEFSSRFLVASFAVRTQVTSKLLELKTGLMKLIEANQDGAGGFSESSVLQLTPYGNYELFACFKKDMHKVETYLTVAKCRLFPEANCTL